MPLFRNKNEINNSKNKRRNFLFFVFILLCLEFALKPSSVHAFLGGEAVIGVLNAVSWALTYFVTLAAHFLAMMLSPDLYNFSQEKIIQEGWIICRDTCNMFFLLILLFIAFCTILQIEKYHAKKTLLTLIIMALLINFSKPIAIFIFDGPQLLMTYFLKANVNYDTTVGKLSKIAEILYQSIPSFANRWITWKSDGSVVTQQIFVIIFQFMYFIALLVMGIFLLIRIVAMWILIIVSPFAFLFQAVPDLQKMASDWWSALFKYALIGPVIAFFLYLSTYLATSKMETIAQQYEKGDSIVTLPNFIAYSVILIFLYASIIMAQKFGTAGAAAITSRANKALAWGGRNLTGYNAAKWGAKKGAQATGIPQAYQQIKADWQRRGIPIPGTSKRIGGPEAGERRGAAIAERMGVSGAYAAHIRKSAKDLENLSNDELIAGTNSGRADYALALSGRGKLSEANLDKVFEKNKKLFLNKDGKWDMKSEYAGMMFKNSVEKGEAHAFSAFEAKKSQEFGIEGVEKGKEKGVAFKRRWGTLTANQLGNQNLSMALGKALDDNGEIVTAANNFSKEIGKDVESLFKGLNPQVKQQFTRQGKAINVAIAHKADLLTNFSANHPTVEPKSKPPDGQSTFNPSRDTPWH